MSKIDEVNENLNTLRIALSLSFGLFILIVGALIKRYDKGSIDFIYWMGVASVFVVFISILFIVKKISNKTKEIGRL